MSMRRTCGSIGMVMLAIAAGGCAAEDDPAPVAEEEAALAVAAEPPAPTYAGSSFDAVWNVVASDAYGSLPHERVTLASFFGFGESYILEDARRILRERVDLRPWFQKLVHPN